MRVQGKKDWGRREQGVREGRSHTDTRTITVGRKVLRELAFGGTDEVDRDLVRSGGLGCGGSGDHRGQKGDSGGDGEGLHVDCLFLLLWDE